MLAGNYKVYGYKHHGYWGYTRTPQEYWQTSMDLLGDPPKIDVASWQICTNLSRLQIRDRQPALIRESSQIEDSLLYSGCQIKGKVVRSILFPGVQVDSGSVVENSILFSNTVVKRDARVVKTIADENVTIGIKAEIGDATCDDLTIIGTGTRVAKETKISSGVTVYPNLGPAQFTRNLYHRGEVIQ
jgi:glucose-1-phosphate adenylyltransferase